MAESENPNILSVVERRKNFEKNTASDDTKFYQKSELSEQPKIPQNIAKEQAVDKKPSQNVIKEFDPLQANNKSCIQAEVTDKPNSSVETEVLQGNGAAKGHESKQEMRNPLQNMTPRQGHEEYKVAISDTLLRVLLTSSNAHALFKMNPTRHASTANSIKGAKYIKMPFDIQRQGKPTNFWDFLQEKCTWLLDYVTGLKGSPICYTKFQDLLRDYNYTCFQLAGNFEALKISLNSTTVRLNMEHVVRQALLLPVYFGPEFKIPILKQKEQRTIMFTQHQIQSILANAFLCTFPKQNGVLQHVNFCRLFELEQKQHTERNGNGKSSKVEKLKCIYNYFNKMSARGSDKSSIVSFERRIMNTPLPKWKYSNKPLGKINIQEGSIEGNGQQMLRVDFANSFVGGGVLGNGALMEEILFSICPELIVSILFTEQLLDNEVLIITGTEQFSKYKGYGHSFEFDGSFDDRMPLDKLGRRSSQIVAMDALHFNSHNQYLQYNERNITRELTKCYTAFKPGYVDEKGKPIASGNWGCGGFNGDPDLKFIIQWLVASEVGRELFIFLSKGHEDQIKGIRSFHQFLQAKNINTVGDLYKFTIEAGEKIQQRRINKPSVFGLIKEIYAASKNW